MKYPDVWGEETIFAFSGLEGKTDFSNPFVAGTTPEFGNFVFRAEENIKFGIRNIEKHRNIKPEIISSDIIITKNPQINIVFSEKDTIVGNYSDPFIPYIENSTREKKKKYVSLALKTKNGALVLLMDEKNKKFSFAYDRKNKETAFKKAIFHLNEISIKREIRKKLNFFDKVFKPKFTNEKEEKTYLKAISVMKVNCESAQGKIKYLWTTPDRWPHRYMWFWDSAFHTLGNSFISLKLAESTLMAVLSCQRKDGFISITMGPEKSRIYEDLTQPPLFAWAGLKLFKKTKNYEFLEIIHLAISKYIKWLYENRDRDKDGLLEWTIEDSPMSKCGECGMDNSPRFDAITPSEPVAAIDLNCFAINEMEQLSEIAKILGRKEESDVWRAIANEKKMMVNKFLWDKQDGFYYDRKRNGEFVRIKTVASFLPLFAGIPEKEKARKLIEKLKSKDLFWTNMPLPSVAKNEETFSKDMWRGGTWLNYNFMIYSGLMRYGLKKVAKQLIWRTKKAVENWYLKKGSIFEFYDPDNQIAPRDLPRKDWLGKKGWTRTIADYQWSAAIYVAILNELRKEKN